MSWELEFLLWIQDFFCFSWLNPVMLGITKLGDMGFVWLVIIAYLAFYKKDRQAAFAMLVALGLTVLVGNVVIKNIVARARPFEVYPYIDLLLTAPKDYSFPSGHTASSFAVAAIIQYFYPKQAKYAWVLACLIAFSRMFLFVHFPTDILGGIVLGLACGYFTMMLHQNGWLMKKEG